MTSIGVGPEAFRGRRVLDVGCGSCEKASFYADWGAKVVGLEMTPPVIRLARTVIGTRDVTIVQGSLFDYSPPEKYDIVIADGVLHHCENTQAAFERCASFVAEGGILIVGLINVWGRFWWFKGARGIVNLLGCGDPHRRAQWGRRLFGWTRRKQESTGDDREAFFRTQQSWAYDWFAIPRWNAHRPAVVRRWLEQYGLDHMGSNPPCLVKAPARNLIAVAVRSITGAGPAGVALYWLASGQPNMFYIAASKRAE
jgi:SAM-dependent methyltransferase